MNDNTVALQNDQLNSHPATESSFWTQKCNVGVVFNGTAYQAGLSPLEIAAGAALFTAGLMIGAKQ